MRIRTGFLAAICAIAALVALPAAASALTKTVSAGPPSLVRSIAHTLGIGRPFVNKYSPDFDDFFQRRVTINAGDSISFVINGFHNVDLPGSTGRDLPLIVPGAVVTGVLDAGGNPFWFNNHVPSLNFNPLLFAASGGHSYNGSTRVDTGLPLGSGGPKPYKVTFTKAGTYKYYCDVHPGMIGYVVVKPKGNPVPSKAQDIVALKAQITSSVRTAIKLTKTKAPAGQVNLGQAGANGVELFTMFPSTLSVNVGAVVTFSMTKDSREVHTASFGPTAYLMQLANGITSPTPGPRQIAFYPSDPVQPIPFSSTSHTNGFANTGGLDTDPTTPLPFSGKIKFTKAGTYHFICLIHPFMQGTIVVK